MLQSTPFRWLMPFVLIAVATLATLPLRSVTVHSLSLLFILAIIFTAYGWGLGPGLLAAALAVVSFDYFFDGTPYHIDVKLAGLLRMSVFTSVAGFMAYLTARQRKTMAKLAATNVELEKSYEEITALRGILPICVHCKQIRNDQGLWERVEKYISEHSEARFSHGVCPECCRKHYPEVFGAQ